MPKMNATPAPVPKPRPVPAPKPKVVKLVNRGAAGLLNKGKPVVPAAAPVAKPGKINNIAPALCDLTVLIDSLTHDPDNARLHPERNMEAIKTSLTTYGQLKPVVVRREGMVVMAGNGTMAAARELGWTEIAASVVDMTEAQAAGFGLADNRTAELASWDFEVVSRLERLASDAGLPVIGWSTEELEVLRKGSYVAPPEQFPEVDESIETEHVCPKCGYAFSGGEVREVGSTEENGNAEDE